MTLPNKQTQNIFLTSVNNQGQLEAVHTAPYNLQGNRGSRTTWMRVNDSRFTGEYFLSPPFSQHEVVSGERQTDIKALFNDSLLNARHCVSPLLAHIFLTTLIGRNQYS